MKQIRVYRLEVAIPGRRIQKDEQDVLSVLGDSLDVQDWPSTWVGICDVRPLRNNFRIVEYFPLVSQTSVRDAVGNTRFARDLALLQRTQSTHNVGEEIRDIALIDKDLRSAFGDHVNIRVTEYKGSKKCAVCDEQLNVIAPISGRASGVCAICGAPYSQSRYFDEEEYSLGYWRCTLDRAWIDPARQYWHRYHYRIPPLDFALRGHPGIPELSEEEFAHFNAWSADQLGKLSNESIDDHRDSLEALA